MIIKIKNQKIFLKKTEVGEKVPDVNRLTLKDFVESYKNVLDTPSAITHNINILYTEEFFKQLKSMLGKPTTFNKEKKINRLKIQKKIDSLFLLESHYKYYHKKSAHNQKPILNILAKEFRDFTLEYASGAKRNSSKKNVLKKFFTYKIETYLRFLFLDSDILSSMFQAREKDLLQNVNFERLSSKIDVQELFLLLCSCSLKIAYNKLITGTGGTNSHFEGPNFSGSYLRVESFELKKTFKFRFLFLLVSEVLTELETVYRRESEESVEVIKPRIDTLRKELESLGSDLNPKLIERDKISKINKLAEDLKVLQEKARENTLSKDYLFLKLSVVVGHLRRNKSFIEVDSEFEMFESACTSILDIFEKTVVTKLLFKDY